ncbi:hypothetical protein DFH08DRAFT_815496 [Mycena albidolilacea]|uniref:Uncharacterized protein n=1 Tax=Mycena albidolilacea TaxID=1033008 RepID=A0AAD6ZMA1_9AGAR|nr:hypothetical protein DFH08DRAFT_815496 [Mycena albidolilacea]
MMKTGLVDIHPSRWSRLAASYMVPIAAVAACLCAVDSGVGHYNIVIPPEDEPAAAEGGEDEEDLNEPAPPVLADPEILLTPPGSPNPADMPLPDRPSSSLSTNSSSLDSSGQMGFADSGSEGDEESNNESGSVVDNLGPEDGDGDVEEEVEEGYASL